MGEIRKSYEHKLNAFWLKFVKDGPSLARLRSANVAYVVDVGHAYAGLVDCGQTFQRSAATRPPWKRETLPLTQVDQPEAPLTELTEYLGRTLRHTILFLDDGAPTCLVECITWWAAVPR